MEQFLNSKSQLAILRIKPAFSAIVARPTSDPDNFLVHFLLLNPLHHLHLVLRVGLPLLANRHLMSYRSHTELDPLDQVARLVGEVEKGQRSGTRVPI